MRRDQQERFAREYVIDLNGTRAAIAAGYSENSATVQASQLLARPNIRKRVDQLLSERAQRSEIKADRVLEETARLAFSNMQDYIALAEDGSFQGIDLSKVSRDQASAIQELRQDETGGAGDGERKLILRTTLKLADKLRALELTARLMGMLTDRLSVDVNVKVSERLERAKEHLQLVERAG